MREVRKMSALVILIFAPLVLGHGRPTVLEKIGLEKDLSKVRIFLGENFDVFWNRK